MKRIIAASIIIMYWVTLNGQVNFREIQTGSEMDQVWKDAESLNKPVFVDIYATWCGPCKWMDANVFALEAAGDYMNNAFINVKMDGESDFGRMFAMQSGLSAYPSFFVFSAGQKIMNMVVGAKPWEEMELALQSTLDYFPVLEVLQSKFESGLLKREEYPRFINALREMGKEDYGTAVAKSYMQNFIEGPSRTEEDIQVLAFFTTPQTDDWTHLTADISALQRAMGIDLEGFIDHAVTITIESAVDNGDIEYIRALGRLLPDLTQGTTMDPSLLEDRSYIYYYHYSGQFDELIRFIDNEYEAKRKGDHEWLFDAAANAVFLDPQNSEVAESGLKWFQTCIDLKETQEYYYHLALCEYFTGSPEKTVVTLKKSLDFTDDPEIIETTRSIIKELEEELN
jgi:thiol-disulfide isomerase/thioredoxin